MDRSKLSTIEHLLLDTSSHSAFSTICATSSSSSSEELDCEVHAKVDNFVEVIDSYSNAEFKTHMRLQRATVEYLIACFDQSEYLEMQKGGRKQIGARKSVYLYTWYIANVVTFRQLGILFGIAKSAAWVAVRRVTSWLVSIAGEIIKWPQGAAAQEIRKKFEEKRKFPNVIGAIDCTHIQIKAPHENKQDYLDWNQNYSLVLQAVVDSKKRFIDVNCGEPGSRNEIRVLRNSYLYRRAETHYDELFSGDSFLLGDSAYPSKSWIVTPFKDNGHLSERQRRFNCIHFSTRMVVENAFGMLKGRFRRLLKLTEQTDLLQASKLILSACVLHNICITMNDFCDEIVVEPNENSERPNNESVPPEGVRRRATLFQHLLRENII